MEENEEIVLEFSEEDVVYYLEDEDGNEVGVCLMVDGKEEEFFYAGDADDYVFADEPAAAPAEEPAAASEEADSEGTGAAEEYEEIVLEFSEEDVVYYIEDEDGNELGVCLMVDGKEEEFFYAGDAADYETVENAPADQVAAAQARAAAISGAAKEKAAAAKGAVQGAINEFDPNISAEGVRAATQTLNSAYKEAAGVAKELKESYEEIAGALDFLKKPGPGKALRKVGRHL